ncbi:PaaX family transcriptional regulator C-terminal domain-containing protein [Actinoplanes sp. NPDC051513]|uniref:PaaX family transcriptional regulator n=1 Tax=Actinoplanes sp. NPDC051513 TaxID=3363908 RepID=UPI0037962682
MVSEFDEACRDRLTPSRRYEAGAGGVRGMLTTILGEFARRSGEPTPSAALIEVLGRFGVGETTARQALLRAAKDGWFVRVRDGRRTLWQLSRQFEHFLDGGEAKIYGFRAVQRDWDGQWLLVLARADDRAGRHVLETRLSWVGFGNPAPGMWISTHTDRAGEAERVLEDAKVRGGQVFQARHLRDGELPGLVGQAWDLERLGREYDDYVRVVDHESDDLMRLLRLVHGWRRFRLIDPALPVELLPDRWSGLRAAEFFHRHHPLWRPAAMAEWSRLRG